MRINVYYNAGYISRRKRTRAGEYFTQWPTLLFTHTPNPNTHTCHQTPPAKRQHNTPATKTVSTCYIYWLPIPFLQPKMYNRTYKWCPIKGCKAKAQQKLSNHLSAQHSHLSPLERAKILRSAKTAVKGVGKPLEKGQPSLEHCFHKPRAKSSNPVVLPTTPRRPNPTQTPSRPTTTETTKPCQTPTDEVGTSNSSTRNFPKFPTASGSLQLFREWLETVDGGKKNNQRAAAIATDMLKYMCNAHPESIKWSMLMSRPKLLEYCKSLESVMTGSGIVQKLDSLDDGLRYMRAEGMGESHAMAEMRDVMKVWRQSYRKDKAARDVTRMERRSDKGPVPLEDVCKVYILL